ncbi:MAG: hypothetical protein JF603_12550 [Acidobacteria bacterium]|nr:hypothetical protein [Acidobacteriota bacterium]
MADLPEPVEDVFHVAVGALVLGINRLQVRRRQLEKFLTEAQAAEQDPYPGTQRTASPKS